MRGSFPLPRNFLKIHDLSQPFGKTYPGESRYHKRLQVGRVSNSADLMVIFHAIAFNPDFVFF